MRKLLWIPDDADMTQLTNHMMDAQKKLTAYSEWLQNTLFNTYVKAKTLMPIHSLDVVVKAGKFVFHEKGHSGFCTEAGIVYITVEPENDTFRKKRCALY